MAKINLLDKSVAELIAAGEVIERPSSVIKELVENSIDAGAQNITVEIKNGGVTYMRVSDDGCGIAHDEIPTAFLRHATSKLYTAEDLANIHTLGFRGEALASVAAVAHVELVTKQAENTMGSSYKIEGGIETEHIEAGCADGTTIIIRDLFFNTPVRLKFLKKDVTEGNQVAAIMDKLALVNPHICFKLIRDGKQVLLSAGDGEFYSAIYSVFGKQFAASLMPVEYIHNNIAVTGYASSPLFARANRALQNFFVNGRYIRSTICVAALEEGYRNSIMTGKFPACVLNINILPSEVDVNVHPTKTEVRFSNEKSVFDAVYFAIKNAILNYNESREIKLERVKQPDETATAENKQAPEESGGKGFKVLSFPKSEEAQEPVNKSTDTFYSVPREEPEAPPKPFTLNAPTTPYRLEETPEAVGEKPVQQKIEEEPEIVGFKYLSKKSFEAVKPEPTEQAEAATVPLPVKYENIRVIGEVFKTYIICETSEGMVLMDKHAAHERLNFERMKSELSQHAQYLAQPVSVVLSSDEYNAVIEYEAELKRVGIEIKPHDGFEIEVLSLPTMFDKADPVELLQAAASALLDNNTNTEGELFDDALHSMACKASVKANDVTDIRELEVLANEVWNNSNIRFCPHGRPIMTTLTRKQIEKYFSRT